MIIVQFHTGRNKTADAPQAELLYCIPFCERSIGVADGEEIMKRNQPNNLSTLLQHLEESRSFLYSRTLGLWIKNPFIKTQLILSPLPL